MVDNVRYTIHTHTIPIEFFLGMIEGDIKKLIHKYGHKNCGLKHEELCEEIKKIIIAKKTLISSPLDQYGKNKLNREWKSHKKEFFNKLFEKEGFINMCEPLQNKGNPNLQKLKLKHIEFCKKRDTWKAEVEANPEYNACKNYDTWIEKERASFTHEYLNNVKKFTSRTVHKYFSTEEHPQGHDPVKTYLKSKLDCKKYNPPPRSQPKGQVAKIPTNSQHPPTIPNVKQVSNEKNGRSVPDLDSGSAKKELDANISPKSKHLTPDSQKYSPSQTQPGATPTIQDISLIPKAPVSTVNRNEEKQDATPIEGQPPTKSLPSAQAEAPPKAKSTPLSPKDTNPTFSTQSVPAPTTTTVINTTSSQTIPTSPSLTITSDSSPNSGSPLPSNPLLPVTDTKGQDRASQSSTSSDTLATTHPNQSVLSNAPVDSSLPPTQSPVLTVLPAVTTVEGPGTFISSSANTFTTTTAATDSVTISTTNTTKAPILSTQGPSASSSLEATPPQVANGPKATESTTESQPTVTQAPRPLSGGDTGGFLVTTQQVINDGSKQTSLSTESSSEHKDTRHEPRAQSSNIISQTSGEKPNKVVVAADAKLQRTINQIDQMHITSPVQIRTNRDNDQLTPHVSGNPGKIPGEKSGKGLHNNPVTPIEKNDNPNIIPEGIPSLAHILPTLLVILGTLTLLFQLYKYTPFGFLLGRRRKRKKRDLRRTFKIPEKPTYESPNIALHELEDHNLVGQTVENDVYTKLLKINRYKQEMQNRKKKNKKTLIEVHMEVLEEHKNDEWELHKGDFLEICLRGFIIDENDFYSNFPNLKITINNINEKTIEDIQKQEILWNNWIEDHRNILEQWKKEDWFHILKNKWRKEQQIYKEKNNKLQENILNEQNTYSIVSQKEIWKQWISKQAALIDMFNKEDCFKSMVYAQDKEKDNYHINEYNNVTVTSKTELKNEKTNDECGRSKNIIQKLMVQIHMMVLEECIKEDIIKHKELCIDNFIEDIHTKNNYDEKRNVPQCDTDNFNVLKYDEIHTSKNK